jgi:hypothetical protein
MEYVDLRLDLRLDAGDFKSGRTCEVVDRMLLLGSDDSIFLFNALAGKASPGNCMGAELAAFHGNVGFRFKCSGC